MPEFGSEIRTSCSRLAFTLSCESTITLVSVSRSSRLTSTWRFLIMPEMIRAGDLKVGDKFRIEGTMTERGSYIVYCNNGDFRLQHHVYVELIERAMPKFEPGGI